MFKGISCILIWSENYRNLADWYIEKLDLAPAEEINHPEDTGVRFFIGKSCLWIGQHDKVKRENKDIHRHMFNIEVDSVGKAYKYLLSKKVQFLAKPFKAPTFDRYFATFCDLDNNLLQLVGGK